MTTRLGAFFCTLALAATAAFAAAPAAQAAPTTDTTVRAWYVEFLGRSREAAEADPGRQYWVRQIDAGTRPSDALWAITHSREYVEREIAGYYNDHLGRAPDPGAAYWVENAVSRGMALEWVEQNFLASDEYFSDNFGYSLGGTYVVDDWYYDILGRFNASDGEEAYWADRARRVGRLQAVREIYYSDEAIRYRINEHYKNLLFRFEGADFGGLAYWYPKEVESDINVQVLLASTPEFATKRQYG